MQNEAVRVILGAVCVDQGYQTPHGGQPFSPRYPNQSNDSPISFQGLSISCGFDAKIAGAKSTCTLL